jgi:hypothetical protein
MPTIRAAARTALLTAAISACAHAPAGRPPAPAAECFVADSAAAAASPDTVYAIGLPPAPGDLAARDCAGNVLPTVPSPVVVDDSVPPGTDLRDVLDHGLPTASGRLPDVVVTRDPEVLAYAARRRAYRSVPLTWDRTYAVIELATDSVIAAPSAAERDALARDAVQADVRGAVTPFPWSGDSACAGATPSPLPALPPVLGYAAGDPIARQLAERIVALATAGVPPGWIPRALTRPAARMRPVERNAMIDRLGAQRIGAAVTFFDRDMPIGCGAGHAIPAGYSAVPLVDSRAHALVRRGSGVTFYITNDGTLRFVRGRAP